MNYKIKNPLLLKKLLWFDTAAGAVTAMLGFAFCNFWAWLFGLSPGLILIISTANICYSLFALYVARPTPTAIGSLRTLIYANWAWSIISIGLLFVHFMPATLLGKIFLILQIVIVGGLAYLEGRQLVSVKE